MQSRFLLILIIHILYNNSNSNAIGHTGNAQNNTGSAQNNTGNAQQQVQKEYNRNIETLLEERLSNEYGNIILRQQTPTSLIYILYKKTNNNKELFTISSTLYIAFFNADLG